MILTAALLTLLSSGTLVFSSFQTTPAGLSANGLAVTTVQTLALAKSARVTLARVASEKGGTDVAGADAAVRRAANQLKEAGTLLEPLERSNDAALRSGAKQLRSVYVTLAERLTAAGRSDPGLEKAWGLLPLGIAAVTHSLLDGKRSVNGQIVYVRLTRSELTELLKSIKDTFPNARPQPTGSDPVDESINLFLGFLSGGWKGADDR